MPKTTEELEKDRIELETLRMEKAQAQQETLEAKAKLSDLQVAPEPKKKPYTRKEMDDLKQAGHLIGNANQKLSEGHDTEDLQKWDMWLCTLELKSAHIPEIGKEWSIPTHITPMKIEKSGLVANDKSFQWGNNAVNFRERGANKQIFFHFPKGAVEAGKTYDCTYFAKRTGRGEDEKILILMHILACPKATGAPERK